MALLLATFINDCPALAMSLCCFLMIRTCMTKLNDLQTVCKNILIGLLQLLISRWCYQNWAQEIFSKKMSRIWILNFMVGLLNMKGVFNFLVWNIDSKLNWQSHRNYLCQELTQGIVSLKSVHMLYPIYCNRMLYFAFVYDSKLTYYSA